MNTKKILITGSNGMVGTSLLSLLRNKEKKYTVLATDLVPDKDNNIELLDVRIEVDVILAITSFNPDVIIHLAAITNLEECESDPDNSWNTHVNGVRNILYHAPKNCQIIHISTAGVFDGYNSRAYTENDIPNPLNVYGKTKLVGEQLMMNNSVVLRPGWMFGGGRGKDKKFVSYILNSLKNKKDIIPVVDDKFGTPTYTVELSKIIIKIIDNDIRKGLYHVVSSGSTNRLSIAREILKHYDLSDKIKIIPVGSDYFKKSFSVPRASSEVLDNSIVINELKYVIPSWKDSLHEYLNDYWRKI